MKSFSFFVLLNVLILFAYAQDQTLPAAATCELTFALQQGSTCTPCQQALFKHNPLDSSFLETKKQPSDKCLFTSFLFYHISVNDPSSNGTINLDSPDIPKLTLAFDQACADTANNACSESDSKNAYTEVANACDVEVNEYISVNGTGTGETNISSVGGRAISTMINYYIAIPTRDNFCLKINNQYCSVKSFEQSSQNTSTSNTNTINGLSCEDECNKQSYKNLLSYQSSHPPDARNLQKVFIGKNNQLASYEARCPNMTSIIANNFKSDGQKLTHQFYNFSGIILISLVGFIYTTFM
ncbi:hypothetical protein RhiirA5_484673 [Rhizophagus irregularis]|uniref:Transmembrane protein n=1 Tax=Rhizophagus irregularis TaxID=588596 RepID=A0A2N0PG02_9GLOM|nr:hypothetical protein RhiirA5_484673 [Rhizophagus irregularis]